MCVTYDTRVSASLMLLLVTGCCIAGVVADWRHAACAGMHACV